MTLDHFKQLVQQGDTVGLRELLSHDPEARAAINEPIFSFDSPALTSVAAGDNLDLVNVLLEFGADPNRKSSWWAGGFHALYSAKGRIAERLLAAGAIPDACAAAALDRPDLLKKLLAEDPARVHERGGDGQMPLHFAQSREVVDILIDAGADLEARDLDHRATAAEWMVAERGDLAKYLVARGARVDIFLAAALGFTEHVRLLVAKKPAVLSLRTSQGEYGEKPPSSFHIYQWTIGPNMTPLQVAVKFGHPDAVEVMLPFATPVQRLLLACHLWRDDDARAIVRDNPGIVENLEGADRAALTDEAWAPNPKAVALMMELDFDPAVRSLSGPTGGTALHCAAYEGSVDAVAAILAYPRGRALITDRDPVYGGTPLDWCAHGSRNVRRPGADHGAVRRMLIDAGAQP